MGDLDYDELIATRRLHGLEDGLFRESDNNVANIEIIENFIFELKSFGLNKDTLEVANELENLLSDYTRQKQINEEHQKINGELRERVKELEEKNEHLSNTSDYETISLECIHLEEQLEIANSRIQELEEERNHWHGCFIVAMENSIAKEKVIDVIQEYKDKIEQYNEYRKQGKETDVEYYENIANTIVVQALQKLLEGEK